MIETMDENVTDSQQFQHESIRLLTLKSTRQPFRYKYDVKIGNQFKNNMSEPNDHHLNFVPLSSWNYFHRTHSPYFPMSSNFKLATTPQQEHNINLQDNNKCAIFMGNDRVYRDFCGTCYNCGWKAHSQNFCPLKECTICRKWGHTERVCYHRKASNNNFSLLCKESSKQSNDVELSISCS